MPRVAAAAMTVIGPKGIETVRRPEPPSELNEEQRTEWREIVNRMPADWFPKETHGLLVAYCRAISRSRLLAAMIEGYQDPEKNEHFSFKEFQKLLRSENENAKLVATLATKMRISHQAQRDDRTGRPTVIANPWKT